MIFAHAKNILKNRRNFCHVADDDVGNIIHRLLNSSMASIFVFKQPASCKLLMKIKLNTEISELLLNILSLKASGFDGTIHIQLMCNPKPSCDEIKNNSPNLGLKYNLYREEIPTN